VFSITRQQRDEQYDSGGPSFVGDIQNVTVKAGKDAVLHCHVKNLGEYKVVLLFYPDKLLI